MNFHPSSRSSRSSPCFDGIASSRTASACMRYYPNSTMMKARCGDFNGRKEVLELVIFHGSPSSDYPLYSAISSFRSQ
jgi:hypothetical protein